VHANSGLNGDAAPAASAPLARKAADHAVTADPRLAEAQMAVARVRFWFDWDWAAAAAALDRAITLDPAFADAHSMLAFLCSNLGRHADAIAATERGIELDPLNPVQHSVASEVAFRRRDYEAAVIHAQRSIELDAGLWVGHILAAQACEQLGEYRRALEMLTDAERLSDGNSKVISLRGYILARTGQVGGARAAIGQLSETAAAHYVPPYATALIHAGLDDLDASFEWLELAYAVRDIHLTLLPIDAKWDACRADRRFESLLTRCAFTASAGPAGTEVPAYVPKQ
jgi:tetratricopeptide (TPR) repeat protein